MKLKVGFGYDVHKLESNKPLILGGVNILEAELGAVGHSDADVLIHAIIDSLLGASNQRDIGFNYPDTDDRYKGIDSKKLLADTVLKVKNKGFRIENIDTTIALQAPKISKYINDMKQTLSEVLEISIEDITIKPTTTEHLGFEGRKEGVSAYSVCLLSKEEN